MIPAFPNFRSIELTDESEIESFTQHYRPYSDFNFTNLWAWDTQGKRKIAVLNDNLVILFTDYLTGKPFLSFLGDNKPDETALQLIEYAAATGMDSSLHFITEEIAKNLRSKKLEIAADEQNFDYIYLIEHLAHPDGSRLKKKRQLANRFSREYPQATFIVKDLYDSEVQKQLISLFHVWEDKKHSIAQITNSEYENMAINRLLQSIKKPNLTLSTVYDQSTMIGFSIDEVLPHGYAISHFLKADFSYKGVYEYLNEKAALHLSTLGVKWWDWEQDLNIEGLRKVKMSYKPSDFLKKYTVTTSQGSRAHNFFLQSIAHVRHYLFRS